jgi:hypothetical protein
MATTASRTRINITGAVNLATHNHYASVNVETTIDFLCLVEAKYPSVLRIHVF